MAERDDILQSLIAMTRRLGEPARDLVILAEGNTSARIDEETFWLKGSGRCMEGIDESGFVAMRLAPLLELVNGERLSDEETRARFGKACVDTNATVRPSVEAALHAVALSAGGARFVAHTHPTDVNAILCSRQAEEAFRGRLFPDEIVVCGPAPVYVPWTDPGLPLAYEVKRRLASFVDAYGELPKVILLQNHGLIALGQSPAEAEAITAMAVKTARVLRGTYALGGPHPLSAEAVARIHTRPDEAYRRRQLGQK